MIDFSSDRKKVFFFDRIRFLCWVGFKFLLEQQSTNH